MKTLYILLFTGLLSGNLYSQTFWNQYAPSFYAYNASVPTPDGGLMIVTNSTDSSWSVPRLMRIDSAGSIVWSIQMDLMPDFNRGRFVDIVKTYDSCYMAVGQLYSGNFYNGLVMHKFDANGVPKWTKLYTPSSCNAGITGTYESHCIIETIDRGFAVSGSSGAPGGEGMFLFKTDSAGNPEWYKGYYDYRDLAFWYRNLCQDSDSGYVFFNQYSLLNQDALIIHTDKYGNLLMSATLDSLNAPSLNAVFNIDGSVYLCFENGFVKSNLDTTDFWLRTYTMNPYGGYKFKSMEKCQNSDLILSWHLYSQAYGMLRTDPTGMPVWARANTPGQVAGEFFERHDGSFIFQGTSGGGQNTLTDVILFDSTGNMSCFDGPVTVTTDSVQERLRYVPVFEATCGLSVYLPPSHWHNTGTVTELCEPDYVNNEGLWEVSAVPNPTNGQFHLYGLKSPCRIEVFSMDGKKMISEETLNNTAHLDLNGFPKGVYLLKVLSPGESGCVKIVLQ